MYRLCTKLKAVKTALKAWNSNIRRNFNSDEMQIRLELENWHEELSKKDPKSGDIATLKMLQNKANEIEEYK